MKRRTTLLFAALLHVAVMGLCDWANAKERLPGQIMVDPCNASYLVYNRDVNGDGELDPFFLIGPGDPEGFLYLGERQSDGTRAGGRQEALIQRLAKLGGNGVYFQVVRSHGGDGRDDHNPWRNPADPTSGLNPDIIRQWKGWFDAMCKAGIVLFLFIYDDGAHPFDDGCEGTVGEAERAFLRDLVNEFEEYPNIIWVVQEEFKFVGHAGKRRPCDEARIAKAGAIADLIKQFDDYDHPVGVHHNIADPMAFPNHPSIDIYVQQANVRPAQGHGNLATLHAAGQPGHGFDPQHRYNYTMGEGYDWHPKLVAVGDRTMLRKSYYATAMSGGYVMVLGMFPTEEGGDPTDQMLRDMRRLQTFFESVPFNRMAPHDELRHGGTDYVLADPDGSRYILYTHDAESLGVKSLPSGRYSLRWFNPVTGRNLIRPDVEVSGDAVFHKPDGFGVELILYIAPADRAPR